MATKGKKINKDEEKEPLQVFAHPARARRRRRCSARVGCRAPFFSFHVL